MDDAAKVLLTMIWVIGIVVVLWTVNNMRTRSMCFEAGHVWQLGKGCQVVTKTSEASLGHAVEKEKEGGDE